MSVSFIKHESPLGFIWSPPQWRRASADGLKFGFGGQDLSSDANLDAKWTHGWCGRWLSSELHYSVAQMEMTLQRLGSVEPQESRDVLPVRHLHRGYKKLLTATPAISGCGDYGPCPGASMF